MPSSGASALPTKQVASLIEDRKRHAAQGRSDQPGPLAPICRNHLSGNCDEPDCPRRHLSGLEGVLQHQPDAKGKPRILCKDYLHGDCVAFNCPRWHPSGIEGLANIHPGLIKSLGTFFNGSYSYGNKKNVAVQSTAIRDIPLPTAGGPSQEPAPMASPETPAAPSEAPNKRPLTKSVRSPREADVTQPPADTQRPPEIAHVPTPVHQQQPQAAAAQRQSVLPLPAPPPMPDPEICRLYVRGKCTYGERCHRSHILPQQHMPQLNQNNRNAHHNADPQLIFSTFPPQGNARNNNIPPPNYGLPPRFGGAGLALSVHPPSTNGQYPHPDPRQWQDEAYKMNGKLDGVVEIPSGQPIMVKLPPRNGSSGPTDLMQLPKPDTSSRGLQRSDSGGSLESSSQRSRSDSNTTVTTDVTSVSTDTTRESSVMTLTATAPSRPPGAQPATSKQPTEIRPVGLIPPGICREWVRGECPRAQGCKYKHQPFEYIVASPTNGSAGPSRAKFGQNGNPNASSHAKSEAAASANAPSRRNDGISALVSSQSEVAPPSLHFPQVERVGQGNPSSSTEVSRKRGLSQPVSATRPLNHKRAPSHPTPAPIKPPAAALKVTPPKKGPPVLQTVTIVDPIRVTFGAGFDVQKVVTGFDSLWISVANVPVTTTREALERLVKPFGTVLDSRFHDESQTGATHTTASIQMSSGVEASAVAQALDDVEVFGSRIRVKLSLGRSARDRIMRDSDVHVSWAISAKLGFGGYDTLKAAEKAVATADGTTLRGHYITAAVYEGLPVVGSYNVRFSGMPPDAQMKDINRFGHNSGVMFERPNHNLPKFGIPAVESLLQEFGKIEHMDVPPPPYKNGIVRLFVRFELPDVANVVCQLNGRKHKALAYDKIYVERVHSVAHTIPLFIFRIVSSELQDLRRWVWQYCHGTSLQVQNRPSGKTPDIIQVRLIGDNTSKLAQIKAKLDDIIRGDLVKEDGVPAWDHYFHLPTGDAFFEHLQKTNPATLIRVDKIRRSIRIIGPAAHRSVVRDSILSKLAYRREHKIRYVELNGRLIGVFMGTDLLALQEKYGPENVWLDLERRALCVRGPDRVLDEVQKTVRRIQKRHPSERADEAHCPICFETPTLPIALECGHSWCKACLARYLLSSVDSRHFPLRCLGASGTCTEPIPLPAARHALTPAEFQSVAQAAFHTHVQARPDSYHYCPTPDCAQVYRPGPRDAVLSCPGCLARICAYCATEYHEGVTCADRELGLDALFEAWAGAHDVKRCPGCRAPIERAEGCNHMTCTRCRTHTCWVCLETFPQGQGIYDHMRETHGGIGL